jgi:hypothetical protein
MNDTTPTQVNELVFRRLVDPIQIGPMELPPEIWVVILSIVLLVGFFFIGWMYLLDSRGIGPVWSVVLGLLRASVYVLLAWMFLLPGRQTVESRTAYSKVILVFDTSDSMSLTVDEPPRAGVAYDKMPTRQDKVLAFLTGDRNFIPRLEEKNPVTAYRFGKGVDENFWYFDKGRNYTRAERQEFELKMKDPAQAKEPLPEPKALQSELLAKWLMPIDGKKPQTAPDDWSKEDKQRFFTLEEENKKLRDRSFFRGTNVSDSVQSALIKELGNMVQGIVVFTDGHSTEGSDLVYEDLERRAKAANIPIFVVGIGEDRLITKIEIVDTRGPLQVQPEDTFKIVGEVTGQGLDEQDVDVTLVIQNVKKGADGKEEELEITVVEGEDKTNPNKKREEKSLGKTIVLKPEKKATFDRGTPPRVQSEYVINAINLAKAAGIELEPARKWELGETKDSELRARQHVPKDRLEVFPGPEHVGDPLDFRVIKRPVRVLLMASGPTHDFQFLNTLMVREVEKKRGQLSVYMQLPPGRAPSERRTGVVLGTDRLLEHFPNRLDKHSDDPNEKLYDLADYDVVVGFDPDWSQVSEEEMKLLKTWVDKGGGLIVLGGPINTLQLARPGASKDKVKPILELYPVILKDVRIDELDRTTEQPWPLSFDGATPEMEFLKLDDNPNRRFLADWEEFFYGKELTKGEPMPPVMNGFYNYYPADAVKVGAQVVARFTDPRAKMKDGTQMPYIVLSDPNSGRRVVWIAYGETRRLRKHSEQFHERFWTKLLRYAAANNQSKINKRISLNMSNKYKSNQFIQIDARIDGPGGDPLPKDKKVKIQLKLPTGVEKGEIPTDFEMKPKPGRDPLDAGKFQAKFQVRSPGEYTLELRVEETGDTESRKFSVVEANPELDDTKPDFDRMYRMASEAEPVFARMAPDAAAELKKKLTKPKLTAQQPGKDGKEVKDDGKTRLYFTLSNADQIPNCMVTVPKTHTSRGEIKDTWDGPLDLSPIGMPVSLPYWWLWVSIGLFSIEWLTRKLLRLA